MIRSSRRKTSWKDAHCWLCGAEGSFSRFVMTDQQRAKTRVWLPRFGPALRALIEGLGEIRLCTACQRRMEVKPSQKGTYA